MERSRWRITVATKPAPDGRQRAAYVCDSMMAQAAGALAEVLNRYLTDTRLSLDDVAEFWGIPVHQKAET